MKYKPENDIPTFAQRYGTVNPSELARIISEKRHRRVSSEAIRAWLKRHPEIYTQLTKIVSDPSKKRDFKKIPDVVAELIPANYDNIEIVGLETLELARKRLDVIETDIKTQICREKQLLVLHGQIKRLDSKKRRKRSHQLKVQKKQILQSSISHDGHEPQP